MEMRQDSPERRSKARPDADELHQAALLIDFDNVTMGIRSNLGQELRNLLNSDVIRGKVAVQRAYADWRRYPQYIVPLSEASIDLIFAPAYGSSKKNATDIRLAIDALELVFVRPEIKTFILMSGDSDFSSLVLKLKEYGRYVIGVGIQESSSDLLVQNCDEYYSYTSLSGLSKTSDLQIESHDPWVLVGKAIERMVERGDTMRSDRLKQVMLEIDPSFGEKEHGFNKFNRFVVEAASRGLVSIQKMENGQYGVAPGGKGAVQSDAVSQKREAPPKREAPMKREALQKREPKGESRRARGPRAKEAQPTTKAAGDRDTGRARPKLTMKKALELLDRALDSLLDEETDSVRDSDVKRRILEFDPAFDEGELGYSKFSKFLLAAEEQKAIVLTRGPDGNYHAARPKRGARRGKARQPVQAERSAEEKQSTVKRLARFLFGGPEDESPEQAKAEPAAKPRPQEAKPKEAKPEKSARARAPEPKGRRPEKGAGDARRSRKGAREPRGKGAEAARGERVGASRRSPRGEGTSPRGGKRREESRGAGPRGGQRRGRSDARSPRQSRERRRPQEPSAAPSEAAAVEAEAGTAAAAVGSKPEPKPEVTPTHELAAPGTEVSGAEAAPATPGSADESKTSDVASAPLPGAPRATIRGRWGTRGRYRPPQAPPPVFEGQRSPGGDAPGAAEGTAGRAPAAEGDLSSIVARLTGYAGVGEKTAETLVDAFGADTFRVLDEEPERVKELLPENRAERVLEARREERRAGGA
ncbi:MAG: NYN domain-containing protein [Gemmatimonadota bacterium]|nr:MAG: NYN domain-containing protein [Gemmatimonadota bacterium]